MLERYPQQSELCNAIFSSTCYRISKIKEKILSLLGALASRWSEYRLIQFWAPTEDGRCLQTLDQPFTISDLHKGLCWYRKQCMKEGGREEQLGPTGRAYLNKHPESTPDLRLYSPKEFTLRGFAARCGLRSHLALPVFDLINGECYGVLEVSSFDTGLRGDEVLELVEALQVAELRNTHVNFFPISYYRDKMPAKYEQPIDSEISKMLELAIKAVPQLNLAQVWVPCKQCSNTSNNLSCMERAAFIYAENGINLYDIIDSYTFEYLQACEFHNLQRGKEIGAAVISSNSLSCLCQNICDFGITENPLAHYAQRARLSIRIALCLKSVHNCNDLYVIEFFLQSNCREDACGGTFLNLLLRIMEMELKIFKVAKGEQLGDELLVECRQTNAIGYDSILCVQERNHHQSEELNILVAMEGHGETYSESEFTRYTQTENLCCQRLSQGYYCSPAREKLSENDFNSNSTLVHSPIKEKIELLMKKIATKLFSNSNRLVQFWAPEINASRCCLSTSDQPFALNCLGKGLAFFRKQCMKHLYFVDERAKVEELGPPGRVFRNGHPETTPDLFLYSTREFLLRNEASRCGLRIYFALPVFDKDQHDCVGVLEFVGFKNYAFEILDIGRMLEAVGLSSTHANFKPTFQANRLTLSVAKYLKVALDEIKSAFDLVREIPQLYLAEAWIPYNKCGNIIHDHSYMELALSTKTRRGFRLSMCKVRLVQTRKGMVGMALASENKSCFCRNSCYFRIVEQDPAHYEQRQRLDVCFAICLQSSHTGNQLYVLEFFLNQGPSNYEYFLSILPFLLSTLKQKLKNFKVASGQQLGEELVVEVIEFSEANKLFSEIDQRDTFPLKFKAVQYYQKEHQISEDQQVQYVSHGMDSFRIVAQEKQCNYAAANSKKEGLAKKTERGERKTVFNLNLGDLEPNFGKRLKDVGEELGVGKSTIKRTRRYNGIDRWPCDEKQKKNSSLFETDSARKVLLDTPIDKNVPQPDYESTQHVTAEPENEKIIIKAKYEDDIVKFQLCFSSGMDRILEEVGMRLKLKMGSFKLKYLDGDNDEILLACDVDLQLCLKSFRAAGRTCLQLFVQLI